MSCKYNAIALSLVSWIASALTAGALRAENTPAEPLAHSLSSFHQQVWRTEQGLPQNTVPAIVQSNEGYLWFGTELGLVRFDGLHFNVFDKSNTSELKSNLIDALLKDRNGDLWIGTLGGGLTRYSKGHFETFTAKDGLSGDSVLALLQDKAGDIWVGTDGSGLNHFHNGHFSVYRTNNGLADDEVFALAQDENGDIWIGTHDGLSRLSNGVIRNYTVDDGLPNAYVRSLAADTKGGLWIGTFGGGLSRWQGGRFHLFTTRDGLSSNSIASLRMSDSGDLWIGTFAGGINRFHDGHFESYGTQNGLPANDVFTIYQDRDGNMWVGTGGGLTRLFEKSLFTAYGKASGITNETILPVFEDHAGAIWLGTNGGGLNVLRKGKAKAFTTKDGLADNVVFSIAEDFDDALWIGTRKGLNRFAKGRFTTFTKKDGLPSDTVIATYTDHEGAVWIGTRAGLAVWKNHRFQTFTNKDGLSNNVVQAIYEDREYNLWVGTAGGGLDRFKDGSFDVIDARRGLSNNNVLSIHEDAIGDLWIGTNGGGLDRLRNGKLAIYTKKSGLADDAIFRILEDNFGNLWMSSNRGVFHANIQALEDFANGRTRRIHSATFGTEDGMATRECNGGFQPAGWKSNDGRLWFPTMQGVVAVDSKLLESQTAAQPVYIDQILIDGHAAGGSSSIRVPSGQGELEFHYSAPNFRSPHRLSFKYRLDGFDSDWVYAQGRHIAYYTNIPPGDYRFEVVATNENGTWSSLHAAVNFELQPHFSQTLTFYALCFFGLVGTASAAHFAQVRRLRHKEKVLEQRVNERTTELRNEVAERQSAEAELLKAKEAAERASRVKSEFLANMSHEIRTPMNGILGMTKLALATELNAQQKQFLEIIKDSADSLLTVIDDILDFSKVEAGKLEVDPVDLNLRESLESTIKLMAFRAEQKNLRLHYVVDPGVPKTVLVDPVRLRQIVINLVGNAIKFTAKGEVVLRVSYEPDDSAGEHLHFIVSDTGIGIPQEKLTSIFEAFSQADSSTTRRFGGTGLGLAICSRLARLMGGSIWAESELGRGSNFHFTIRIGAARRALHSAQPAADAAQRVPEIVTSNTRLSALIAEDNPANRMVARLTLEQAGFSVHEVDNGEAALDAVRRHNFDVAVMDCRMPLMDGFEATRQIRNLPGPTARLPIIALTASAFKEDRERAQQSGMDDFLAKPFEERELVSKCIALANSSRSEKNREPVQAPAKAQTPENNSLAKYSPEFLSSIMEIFLENSPSVFEKLQSALQKKEWAEARESAHWLQGGATRVVDPSLQEQLQKIEKVCESSMPHVSAAEIELLQFSFAAGCLRAEKWLREYRSGASLSNVR